ncbi:Na+/H+ antiporter [Labilithrix luteola]|uniref:Na+/H+ antiporter n=1 Tax=Labilithrix luteola TaxID=1391654 RepID=A0A0K1PPN1_9BACT|nr:sodium:proton antiporter [Labilithrix luteola]AKU95477.1 Na+/H+ antiporter [Labilithrix luteola]
MILFELVIGLLFVGALGTIWSDRVGIPYPALLALVGTLIALVPGAPGVELDPELALALFVAPTLLDAAYDASPRDLKKNLGPVLSLAVVMVVLTVMAVAVSARIVVPEMGWAAAIALGAIVAPPDASAATAVLRKLQPPHQLLVVLEGESLFNDASSLLIYRIAVGAAVTGAFSAWKVVPMLLLTCGGGVVVGWLLARLQIYCVRRVHDVSINVLLQFVGTFAVWMIAERIGLSAIITVVSFAMTVAQRMAGRMSARHRIASYAVWDVAVLVLNVLAFVMIGLQLRAILSRVHGDEWRVYALTAGAVCAAVILVRVVWILTYSAAARWTVRRFGPRRGSDMVPPPGSDVLASWCGMRGIVTLATALALPNGSPSFPYRDLIIFSAFCVVLTTLVLQGSTLRPLMRGLELRDNGIVEREIDVARAETARAALRVIETSESSSHSADMLRREYEARLHAGEARVRLESESDEAGSVAALQRRAVMAQRDALTELRARRVIGDDAFHVLEEEIDLLELTADARIRPTIERPAS